MRSHSRTCCIMRCAGRNIWNELYNTSAGTLPRVSTIRSTSKYRGSLQVRNKPIPSELIGVVRHIRISERSRMMQCRIHQSELSSHAITEHSQIRFAAVDRDTGSAVREKIQNIVVKLEAVVFGTWHTP